MRVQKGRRPARRTREERLKILVGALAREAVKLLDYLDEEYFEDIPYDPRFEQINKLLSLHTALGRNPNDPNLERFFDEIEGGEKRATARRALAACGARPSITK